MQPLYFCPMSPAQEWNTENITLAEITSEAYYSKAQNTQGYPFSEIRRLCGFDDIHIFKGKRQF